MILSDDDVRRLKVSYPHKIFVIIKKDKSFKHNWHSGTSSDTVKIMVSYDTNIQALRYEIYGILKRLNSFPVTDAIYLSNGRAIIGSGMLMDEVAERYGRNGVLYLQIHGENTFG